MTELLKHTLNAIFVVSLITVQIFLLCRKQRYRLVKKDTAGILRTKEMLNFALSSIPKGGKNATFISLAFEATISIA